MKNRSLAYSANTGRASHQNFRLSTLNSGPLSLYDVKNRTTFSQAYIREKGKVIHPYKRVENETEKTKIRMQKIDERRLAVNFHNMDEIEQLEYYAYENQTLRDEVKVVNQTVNQLIDQVKEEKLRKKQRPTELPAEKKTEVKHRRMETLNKLNANLEEEYKKLVDRTEILQNPLYAVDL